MPEAGNRSSTATASKPKIEFQVAGVTVNRLNGRRCLSQHRKCWLIAGGRFIWCYECGAIRPNEPGKMKWAYPVGPKAENPAMQDKYLERLGW